MNGWFGPWELLILVLIVLLVFGPKRLPEIGRGLGKGMREFKDSVTGKQEKEAKQAALTAASAASEQAPETARTSDTVSS
jgi:sec-independent protein translocase protein TatA